MAARFDVRGRLAEGLTAVDDMQTYVNASRVRGYGNGDLTLHSSQVREWYNTEDGLDLSLLGGDCAQLRAAAQVAGETLRDLRSQGAALTGAWDGGGGDAAAEFIGRHCAAGATVTEAMGSAADACATLRDELWRIVDRKVADTVAIGDRAQSERPVWLAAAEAVIAGVASEDDRSVAVVDAQVKPFVDSVIRGEWVPAMHSSVSDVDTAYRAAVNAISAQTGARFEVPGDLGPRRIAPVGVPPAVTPATAALASTGVPPAARSASGASLGSSWLDELSDPGLAAEPPPPSGVAPAAMAPLPPNPLEALMSPASSELPASPSGLGSLPGSATGGLPTGDGLGDIAGRLADLFGGLLDIPGGDGEVMPDAPELSDDPAMDDPNGMDAEDDDVSSESDEVADPDEPVDVDSVVDHENPCGKGDSGDTDTDTDTDCSGELVAPESELAAPEPTAAEPAPVPPIPEPPSAPTATAPPAPAPPAPAPLAGPAPEGATPCEIAADELPQAGQ